MLQQGWHPWLEHSTDHNVWKGRWLALTNWSSEPCGPVPHDPWGSQWYLGKHNQCHTPKEARTAVPNVKQQRIAPISPPCIFWNGCCPRGAIAGSRPWAPGNTRLYIRVKYTRQKACFSFPSPCALSGNPANGLGPTAFSSQRSWMQIMSGHANCLSH